MTTSSYHHGTLREELLTAARAALVSTPANDLSLRALAKQAGVSHAAPYRHFGDQRGFLLELAADCLNRLVQAEQAAVDAVGTAPRARALAIGLRYIEWAVEHPYAFNLIFDPLVTRSDPPPNLAAAIGRHQAMLRLALDAFSAQTKTPVASSPEAATAHGTLLWGAVHGLAELGLAGLVDQAEAAAALGLLLDR